MLSLSDLVTIRTALAQRCPLHTSSLIALYRKVRRQCFEALWLQQTCKLRESKHYKAQVTEDVLILSQFFGILTGGIFFWMLGQNTPGPTPGACALPRIFGMLDQHCFRLRLHGIGYVQIPGGGGGVMPYMCHTETCRRSGYTFWPSNPRQCVFFRAWLQNRVPNLYDHSEPGCLFTVLFDTLPLVLTYLSFVQEINPSFDVFNIFRVIRWHTVQEFVGVSFENNSFLCFDTLFRWLLSFPSSNLPREFAPPPKKIVLKTIEKLA